MRALHTAATGMMAQELNVQVISNNIANMRTTGYKRQRAEFQDLLYEYVSRVGTQTSAQGNILPAGIELGSGVKTVGTPRLMSQGELTQTGKDFDVAIRGEGFFKILLPDGRTAWVVPGISDQIRMTVGGSLFVARTSDGGRSWQQLRAGLPQDAHDVIYRHALSSRAGTVAFGTTTGNLYVSEDRGDSWQTASNNLPPIYSVRFG